VISRPFLLGELAAVATRPQLSKRVPTWSTDTAALLALLEREPMVALTGTSHGCRDPKDDAVTETALAGRVDYLVTGDQDLLDVHVALTLNAHGSLLTTARALVAKIVRQGRREGE
jgi:putative PIN family toxin of toxin-antitoxin system